MEQSIGKSKATAAKTSMEKEEGGCCTGSENSLGLNQPELAGLVSIDSEQIDDSQLSVVNEKFFSEFPLFVAQQDLEKALAFTKVVSGLPQSDSYRSAVGKHIPPIAGAQSKNPGVLFGYDFHLTTEGPKLIEINTNAGGAYLNYHLLNAQVACCDAAEAIIQPALMVDDFEQRLLNMFQREFHLQAQDSARSLSVIAIVDEQPKQQFLYDEFLMFQKLFQRHGIKTHIVDPSDFTIHPDGIYMGSDRIDLIYNRHTDFYLQSSEMDAIKNAYVNQQVVLSPNPSHYGQLADKRLLTLLSDERFLSGLQLPAEDTALVQSIIPATVPVGSDNADELWRNRKKYFFKPMVGFGSRASYSGAKLTKKTWQYIVNHDYVAQAFVPPDVRRFNRDGNWEDYKTDLRIYSYEGQPLMVAARIYQGQTTNMRTPGGGFAPVFQLAAMKGLN